MHAWHARLLAFACPHACMQCVGATYRGRSRRSCMRSCTEATILDPAILQHAAAHSTANKQTCMQTSKHAGMQAGMHAGRHASRQTGKHAGKQTSRHASKRADMQASIVVCRIEYVYHIGVCIVVRLIVVCHIEYVLVWHDIVVFDAGHKLISHWVKPFPNPSFVQCRPRLASLGPSAWRRRREGHN